MGVILLFYKYIDIEHPEQIQAWQFELCRKLQLTGRIILAHEGINGTLGGTQEQANAYIEAMNTHPLFGDIDFKTSDGGSESFPRLSIKIKEEITRLGVNPRELTVKDSGTYLTPEEAHELLAQKPDGLVVLDGRNDYEARVGRFEDAVCPPVRTFREFPEYIDKNAQQFEGKDVLMYCTGGIRCERASAYLKKKGVARNVYHIKGGIHRYVEKFPNGFFRGKNYVFDNRMVQKVNEDIMTTCDWCQTPNDALTSCVNAVCNKQHVSCLDCRPTTLNTCNPVCKDLVERGMVRLRPVPKGPEL